MNFKRSGFTLIELSIVLVILGLLVGGVLAGQNLIRAAELRAQVSQFAEFDAAAMTFKEKYTYIPGDVPVALLDRLAWDIVGGNGYDNATYGFDGNGKIWPTSVDCTPASIVIACVSTGTIGEPSFFFYHLQSAELWEGGLEASTDYTPGVRWPKAEASHAGITVTAARYESGHFYLVAAGSVATTSHFLHTNAINQTSGGSFMPQDAWHIDTKLDDGIPNTGRVKAVYQHTTWGQALDEADTECTIADGSSYAYNLTYEDLRCHLLVKAAF